MADFHLLIADDDEGLRWAITELLRDTFTFDEAEDGESALRLLTSGRHYDAVVTDFKMPGKNGGQILEEFFRRVPEGQAILISGNDPDSEYAHPALSETLRNPRVLFLAKPFSSMAFRAMKELLTLRLRLKRGTP